MKRLNPLTNQEFKFGDIREDGYLFWGYRSDRKILENGFYREKWISKEKLTEQKQKGFVWRNSNKEKRSSQSKLWYENNKEKRSSQNKLHYQNNKENRLRKSKEWATKNRDKKNAASARRRALKLQATPHWLNKNQLLEIEEFYSMAKELEKIFPWKQEVDHIEPLKGKDICGLHVPWNLQIIPMVQNRSKGINRGLL